MQSTSLRTVNVTRYIQPLREGGSLPALAEADDDFKYVLKFKGNGHGIKSLIAELIGGEIARALGLKLPELVFANLDEAFGRTEADEEIQDLLKASQGLNLGLHFLSGAINFDPVVTKVDSKLASQIVWLDAFITNIDRSAKNTNMLIWNKELWLIDHGSCLNFQYTWTDWEAKAKSPFAYIKEHVLLNKANQLKDVDSEFSKLLTDEKLKSIVELIPDEWLMWEDSEETREQRREIYFKFLSIRNKHSELFLNEAENARKTLI
ncbi:HipA family kinase [Aurantibacillus circumpalustris]|uniref:HipA family kinase n=1 Tax=Aurantibacillus circumpalustris TaxID=3036359 RepID=UPI00295B7D3F|nr:HipA family kinase [Aurantibacillus circumpalustris]